MLVCRVVLLTQENFQVELPKNVTGQVLYDRVKDKINLEEADYFGLSYFNSQNQRLWLSLEKRIDKQVDNVKDLLFYWEVKFYPPAPEQLNEDHTRYLVVLQIRKDLFTGLLPASFQTQAILGSFTAQGEIGDFERANHIGIEYLRQIGFAPKQSEELLLRISDLHKMCKGLTPAEADLYFLDNAKKCALYGMDMHKVKDSSNRAVKIGVSACGIYVYDGNIRMDCFKWPRILKIEYKRNVFRIKVKPGEFEHHQTTLGYQLPSVKLAKRLMRIAVENHQFFRLKQPELTDTGTLRGFGNRRWRLSVRTQNQLQGALTPRKSFSRANSVMSSDTYPLGMGPHVHVNTMPAAVPRRAYRQSDKNYNTIGEVGDRTLSPALDDSHLDAAGQPEGRLTKGVDQLVDVSHGGGSEYLPNETLDETGIAKGVNSSRLPPNARRPSGGTGRHTPTNSTPLAAKSAKKSPSNSSSRRPSETSGPVAAANIHRQNTDAMIQKPPVNEATTDEVSPALTESQGKPVPLPRSISDLTNGEQINQHRIPASSTPKTATEVPISNQYAKQSAGAQLLPRTSFQSLGTPKRHSQGDGLPGSNTEQVGIDAWSPSCSISKNKPSSAPVSPTGPPVQFTANSWSPTTQPPTTQPPTTETTTPLSPQSEILPILSTASPAKSPVDNIVVDNACPRTQQLGTPPESPNSKTPTPVNTCPQQLGTSSELLSYEKTPTLANSNQLSDAGKFGPGELPIPAFSTESAGVMPTGGMDDSVELKTSDRVEKPPTVATTCMKFAGSSPESNTQSTWTPPTVKTEKRQFSAVSDLNKDLNGCQASIPEMVSQTTTLMTEKDGVVEYKVEHTITTADDDEDIDYNQHGVTRAMLLDAIELVTGLDKTLEVDRIDIKTEIKTEIKMDSEST
ncbi:band 4.1-like protein 3 isoform X3 [Watersipora subatra]|uniref:band 4.1-like protein 3 isoform X3 n=1 Tax=Watersipora subatra TaxID=2589382 RepID=UPI00355AE972